MNTDCPIAPGWFMYPNERQKLGIAKTNLGGHYHSAHHVLTILEAGDNLPPGSYLRYDANFLAYQCDKTEAMARVCESYLTSVGKDTWFRAIIIHPLERAAFRMEGIESLLPGTSGAKVMTLTEQQADEILNAIGVCYNEGMGKPPLKQIVQELWRCSPLCTTLTTSGWKEWSNA